MHRCLLLLLTPALLALTSAAASELDDLAAALRAGAETLTRPAADEKKPDSAQQQRLAATLRLFTELDQALARGNATVAQAAAGRLESDATLPPPLRETAGRLRRELPAMFEARDDAFVATVEQLIVRTREQCLTAKTEADLQPLLREVSRLDREKPGERSPYTERAASKLKAAVALLPVWMDYLAAKNSGNRERMEAIFRPLAGGNQAGNYPIVPAAEIQRRLDEINPPARTITELSAQLPALLARAETLRDVPTLAPEIAALPRLPEARYAVQAEQDSMQRWFASFATATAALFAGDLGDAWKRATEFNRIGSESWAPEAIRLRALLVGELVVKSLPLPPAQARRADESMADHLLRISREAAREHRWEDVERIQRLYRTVMGRVFFEAVPRWWADSAELISSYLEGQRLETAGDSAGAVAAYLRVLRETGEFVPTAEAQERLRSLLATQKTTLADVRLRLDAERLTTLVQRLETSLLQLKMRTETAERAVPGRPAPVVAAATGADSTVQLEARLKKLEAVMEKLGKAASQTDGLQTRLSKLETLLAPALEAAPGAAAETKVRLWLGPDFTVYRSAVPPALDGALGWVVRFNGKTVLMRNAKREMQFNYHGRRPGIYTIYLTGADGETPSSNVIDYTLTEEAVKKLGPRTADDDWDRDGARNPPAPREQ